MPEIQLKGGALDGLALHYLVEGRGPAVLLVHGLGDALPDPVMKLLHTLAIERFLFVFQQVGPFQGPKVRELGTLQQLIDQPCAFRRRKRKH